MTDVATPTNTDADALKGARVVVVFRNDDPSAASNLARERKIFGIFERYHIPQTVAVIPKVALTDHHDPSGKGERSLVDNPQMAGFLKDYAQRSGSEIALHGLTHRANRFSIPSRREFAEFKYLPYHEQERMIREGTEILEQAFGVRPRTFVPPWNRLDESTVSACLENGYRLIASGPFVTTTDGILSFGCNTNLDVFQRDFQRAVASGRRVFLNVLFHSITLTDGQIVSLNKAIESVRRTENCQVMTVSRAADLFGDELNLINKAARQIVPADQDAGSPRAKAWLYLAATKKLAADGKVDKLQRLAHQLFMSGEYAACRDLGKTMDFHCAAILWTVRALALIAGCSFGWVLGRLLAGWSILAGAPLVLGWVGRSRLTAADTRNELMIDSALVTIGALIPLVFAIL